MWPELKVTLQYKFSAGISLLSQAVSEETKKMGSQTLLSGPKFTGLNMKGNLNQHNNNKKPHFQASKPTELSHNLPREVSTTQCVSGAPEEDNSS